MTQFYQELLTVRRDANEVYLLPAPEELIGRDFAELSELFIRYRDDRRSCLLIGIQRGDEMMINPIGDEAGPLRTDDQLIVFSRTYPGGLPAAAHQPAAVGIAPGKGSQGAAMSARLPRVVADTPLDATIEGLLRGQVEIVPWSRSGPRMPGRSRPRGCTPTAIRRSTAR